MEFGIVVFAGAAPGRAFYLAAGKANWKQIGVRLARYKVACGDARVIDAVVAPEEAREIARCAGRDGWTFAESD